MIKFCKDGVYFKNDFIDQEDDGFKKLPPEFDIRKHYNYNIILDDDITLDDFFSLLRPNLKVLEQDFCCWTDGVSLIPFFREIQKKPRKKTVNIDCFEFRKELDVNIIVDKYDGSDYSSYEYRTVFYGSSSDAGGNVTSIHDVDLLPLNNYKDTPMKINNICISTKIKSNGPTELPTVDVDVLYAHISLHEILGALFMEITMNGTIKERNEFAKESRLMDGAKPIDEEVDEDDYLEDSKIIISELRKRLKEEELNENYDICKKINDDIKVLEKRMKNKK